MSQLRDMLIELQQEKTLRILLGDQYDTATNEQKQHFLSIVGQQIEIDVDSMLHNYIIGYQANTPIAKKNHLLTIVYMVSNIILGIGVGYAVNKEDWVFVTIVGILMIANQVLPLIYTKDK